MPQAAPILGQIALNLAIGAATSVIAGLLSPASASTQTRTQTGISFETEIGEALPIRAVWGLARARHQFRYKNEYGDNNEYLQLVYLVGMGEHDGLDKFLVDEKVEPLEGSNSDPKGYVVTSKKVSGTPYMWVKYFTGAPGQTADAELVARANPPERWTVDHKLTGWSGLIVTMRWNENLFGNTVPQFGSVWRGLKICDFTNPACIWGDPSTYVFSKNPAKLAWYWRRGLWVNGVRVQGMGYSAFANDTAYFTAAANRCDESFYDPETDTTFPLFEFGRQIGDDEDKLAVLQEFEAAWAGSSFKRGGAYAPLVAQQLTPVMTLTDADLHKKIDGSAYPKKADRKGSVSQKKTLWHGQFVSEDNGWALSAYEPRINTTFRSVLGGDRAEALDQPYETNQARAQLRAEIAMRRQLYPATRTETFVPKTMVLEPGDLVIRQCEWGDVPMIVEVAARLDNMTGATLTLREWNNAIVPVSGDSFVTIPATTGTASASPSRTLAVSGLLVEGYQRTGGGAEHPYGKAVWADITDPNVDQVMIRVWPSAGTEANDKEDFFASARLTDTLVFGMLQPLTEYTGYAIPIRSDGLTCTKTNNFTFTTGAETVGSGVADGEVTLAKLSAEMQALVSPLGNGDAGSLVERLDLLAELIERLAATNANAQGNELRQVDLLQKRLGSAVAAIATETTLRVAADEAFATQITDVVASLGDFIGGGLFKIEATANAELATSDIFLRSTAASDLGFAQSWLQLHAEADGVGGSVGYVQLGADDGSSGGYIRVGTDGLRIFGQVSA